MTPTAKENWLAAFICAALAIATFGTFSGAMNCRFVNYDDLTYITSNEQAQKGWNAENIRWAFTTGAASNWHPLTWLSHLADIHFYGLNPAGHHRTSVLLHTINGVLLFLILWRMTGAIWCSAFVAAVFTLHPLRVESVAWVSERKDVLSTFFWMLTVGAYADYARNQKIKNPQSALFYVLSILFFACGLMSKPMLVSLPLILLLLDYWPLGRLERGTTKLIVEKIPYFALAIASSVVTFIVQRQGGAVASIAGAPIGARVENIFVSYMRYLGKIFWPAGLSPLYPYPKSGHWPCWMVGIAVVLLAAITALVIWRARKQPYLAVGWFWFVIMLVPTIGLVQVGIQSMADRYSYVPSVGIAIMLAWGASELAKAHRWILIAAAASVLTACMYLTPLQVDFWRNSETLFSHAVKVTQDNYLACNNLGTELSDEGRTEEAIVYFRKSVEINPSYDEAHNNLGFSLATLNRYVEATNEYIKALSLNAKLPEAHNNLGNALGHLGLDDAALHEYQVALQERPNFADARNNYGVALAMRGKLDDAIAQFQTALAIKPDYVSAHSDLGNALALKGDFVGATREYEFCLKKNPRDAQTHNNLGNVFAQQGKMDEAAAQYRVALGLNPQNPEAHLNLGYTLARLGRRAEAEEQLRLALKQRPNYPEAQRQLDALRNAK